MAQKEGLKKSASIENGSFYRNGHKIEPLKSTDIEILDTDSMEERESKERKIRALEEREERRAKIEESLRRKEAEGKGRDYQSRRHNAEVEAKRDVADRQSRKAAYYNDRHNFINFNEEADAGEEEMGR